LFFQFSENEKRILEKKNLFEFCGPTMMVVYHLKGSVYHAIIRAMFAVVTKINIWTLSYNILTITVNGDTNATTPIDDISTCVIFSRADTRQNLQIRH
jgi:hypothetical protein